MSKGLNKPEKPRPLGHRVYGTHREIIAKNVKLRRKATGNPNVTAGDIVRLSIERFDASVI